MTDNPESRDHGIPEHESVHLPEMDEITDDRPASSRRTFLHKTAKKAAYAAPLVLLFRPKTAIAGSNGSDITEPLWGRMGKWA